MFRTIPHWGANEKRSVSIGVTEPTVAPKAEIRDFGNKSAFLLKITYRGGGAPGFGSGSSGAASKILCAKTGQGAYLGLILIHTKFEKKS